MAFVATIRRRGLFASVAVASFISGFFINSAIACSCPPSSQERTAEMQSKAVKLRLLDFHMSANRDKEPVAIAHAEVLKQPSVGKLPARLIVSALGGDMAANCGAAGALFASISSGSPVFAVIYPLQKQKDAFELISCAILDELKSAPAPKENEAKNGLY